MSPKNSPPLTRRSVVSCFIFKYDDDGKPLVALFQRSGEVHTYKHHLAPISGTIDPTDATPLSAAWRELREETTLTPATLSLQRHGKPYTFRDASIGREWTIYPFAFELRRPSTTPITTDWEHESWGWHDPHQVVSDSGPAGGVGGVPRLAESLRRVWFEGDLGASAGAELARGLAELRDDRESGARQLAGDALRVLRGVACRLSDDAQGRVRWWEQVRFAAWHVWKNGRESMGAAILSVMLAALRGIEDVLTQYEARTGPGQAMEWRDAALEVLDLQISSRDNGDAKLLSEAFAKYLEATFPSRVASQEPICILTLSESSTISHSLRHLILEAGFPLDLRVLESRPLFEGVSLAGSLANDLTSTRASVPQQRQSQEGVPALPRVKITLFSDASAALAAQGVDVVVIGADRIASAGAVSNKTGSLPAILSARHVTGRQETPAKVVVLGESEKVEPPGGPEEDAVEDNDPDQLIRTWDADYNSVRVRRGGQAIGKILKDGRNDKGAETSKEGVSVEAAVVNIYFEWCPAELIDVYMTEFGQWTAEDISKHSERLGAQKERLFFDL